MQLRDATNHVGYHSRFAGVKQPSDWPESPELADLARIEDAGSAILAIFGNGGNFGNPQLPLVIASHLESRYSPPMPKDFICLVCEMPEKKCQCDRYCWLCQSLFEVRLCEDGQYYCQPCREACDMEAQYQTRD